MKKKIKNIKKQQKNMCCVYVIIVDVFFTNNRVLFQLCKYQRK